MAHSTGASTDGNIKSKVSYTVVHHASSFIRDSEETLHQFQEQFVNASGPDYLGLPALEVDEGADAEKERLEGEEGAGKIKGNWSHVLAASLEGSSISSPQNRRKWNNIIIMTRELDAEEDTEEDTEDAFEVVEIDEGGSVVLKEESKRKRGSNCDDIESVSSSVCIV
ncbi:hypothetical protein LENED_001453 [Lentinula edodes]|uniref:Uncharacterized protein n=1 Tax=Lentinula edodes TaxID=5353 RepID=A0A1Q3DY88_LENED|nr:hypothetical protein LENED_001453 [Lentinula edodes]